MIKPWLCAAALGWVAFGSAASAATITVGYSYSVTNAFVASVTSPSFAAVGDLDGYTLTAFGSDYLLASGVTFDVFASTGRLDLTAFTITDIDPSLALDPNDPFAFPIGLLFSNITGPLLVDATPITITTPASVPLPASLPLLGVTLAALGGLSARFRRWFG